MMQDMKQVLIIGGGMSHFDNYETYLDYLRNKTIDSPWEEYTDWKYDLGKYLGAEYQVGRLTMPNRHNAHYIEWKVWFEKHIPFLEEGVILIGHSLGGIFLAKYLAEENFSKKILGTFLVAAPFDSDSAGGHPHSLGDFSLPASLQKLTDQGGKIFLYQSEDDQVVAFAELDKYSRALPNAQVRVLKDRGHANTKEFPELVEDIKSLE
jgi:uncharacterized protein